MKGKGASQNNNYSCLWYRFSQLDSITLRHSCVRILMSYEEVRGYRGYRGGIHKLIIACVYIYRGSVYKALYIEPFIWGSYL